MSVVVVITQESEVYPFIRWGSRFAIALGEPLLVQIVSRTLNDADPVRIPHDKVDQIRWSKRAELRFATQTPTAIYSKQAFP